jgi:hypothetical protein
VSSSPDAYVCTSKDCRKAKCHAELLDALRGAGKVEAVGCQDICKGPVAGVEVGGRIEWFKRVRRHKHQAAVVELARDGALEVPPELRDRWVPKRGGKVKR